KLNEGSNLLNQLLASPNIPQPCQADLDALRNLPAMTFPSGESVAALSINISDIQNATVNYVDATHEQAMAYNLFRPDDRNYSFFAPKDITVADFFKTNRGTQAVTPRKGADLYGDILFRPSYVKGLSDPKAAAFLLHEILHNLGAIDQQIQNVFGITGP